MLNIRSQVRSMYARQHTENLAFIGRFSDDTSPTYCLLLVALQIPPHDKHSVACGVGLRDLPGTSGFH